MQIFKLSLFSLVFFTSSMSLGDNSPNTYTIKIGNIQKEVRLMKPRSGAPVNIAYINFRDDDELVKTAAEELSKKIPKDTELVVIIGDKANGLGVLTAYHAKLPWIILTGKETPDTNSKIISYNSITSGNKKMNINDKQIEKLKGKKIVILDDIISTGSTVNTAITLLKESTAKIQLLMCAFTEEKDRSDFNGYKIVKLGHLPVFPIKRAL